MSSIVDKLNRIENKDDLKKFESDLIKALSWVQMKHDHKEMEAIYGAMVNYMDKFYDGTGISSTVNAQQKLEYYTHLADLYDTFGAEAFIQISIKTPAISKAGSIREFYRATIHSSQIEG